MIDASRFAQPTKPLHPENLEKLSFRFGSCGKDEAAAELRKFADAVERGDIVLQDVQYELKVSPSDYCMEALYFEFATQWPR